MRAFCFALFFFSFVAWCNPVKGQGEPATELSLAKSVVADYCKAWSIVDPAERETAISAIWADRGEYLDSQPIRVIGREALDEEIVKFQQQFAGTYFRCSDVRAHQGYVGYTWSMVMADGTERFKGMDFGEIDSAGRLVRIVSFFDMPQSAN